MECKYEICYEADTPINIGDVFYKVEVGKTHFYREPCKVCGDTHNLTVNGVTFKCPICDTGKSNCHISEFVVKRYRVSGFSETADDSDWKASNIKSKKITLYHKSGRGYSCYSDFTRREYSLPTFINNLNKTFLEDLRRTSLEDCFFSDYKAAVEVAKRAQEKELKKLQEFNSYYEKDYVFIPECENDKPSK